MRCAVRSSAGKNDSTDSSASVTSDAVPKLAIVVRNDSRPSGVRLAARQV
jgi:hypothetical protein